MRWILCPLGRFGDLGCGLAAAGEEIPQGRDPGIRRPRSGEDHAEREFACVGEGKGFDEASQTEVVLHAGNFNMPKQFPWSMSPAARPDVFVNFASPKAAAQAIRMIGELNWKPLQFVGKVAASVDAVMKPAGLDHAEGIVSVAFAKEYSDPQWADDPARNAYGAFMEKYLPGIEKNAIDAPRRRKLETVRRGSDGSLTYKRRHARYREEAADQSVIGLS